MFSGMVKILDLNDYIKPEEECVVLIKGKKLTIDREAFEPENSIPKEIPTPQDKKSKTVTKINLTDCLACSGCVTSSEALLVEEQSIQNFLKRNDSFKTKFMLISPQSLSAIAFNFKISEPKMLAHLNHFFKINYSFKFVADISIFIEIANELAVREFSSKPKEELVFSSECPGWVCYAEKVLSQNFIDLISKIKSPQLFAAELIKNFMETNELVN